MENTGWLKCSGIRISYLDLNLFKVLEALYEEESAGRAALRLGITQSAVSAALNRLRKIYGDHLFERTGRGLKPTTKASELKSSVGDILEKCRQTLPPAVGGPDDFTGRTVILAASNDFEIVWGKKIIQLLQVLASGLRLQFRQSNAHLVQDMLMHRNADIAVTAGGIRSTLLSKELLGTGTYSCIFDGERREMDIEDYLNRNHVLVSSGGFVGIVDEKLAEIGRGRKVIASTTHFSALPWLIKGTDAIATVPHHAARAIAEVAGLHVVACPLILPAYSVELAIRSDSRRDAAIMEVKKALLEIIRL
ncbi:LysR family transcriptional regulator [Klebsiella sp. 2-N_Kleb.]|uniref:LysR family transcriptional regulator n=1 Tax=unclassified Klebsiella TaxID=2608929 RepID=UPI003D165211